MHVTKLKKVAKEKISQFTKDQNMTYKINTTMPIMTTPKTLSP